MIFSRTLLYSALLLTSCSLINNLTDSKIAQTNNDDNQWVQGTTSYSPEWTTISASNTPIDRQPTMNNNKWLASTDDNGNREFLFTDSVHIDKGIITALIEYRYSSAQILPENHKTYTHNHWLEQIDCVHHIRTIRATTQYSEDNQIIDANEYPVPKYSHDDLKSLSKPDDPIIQKVCDIANNKHSNTHTTMASTPADTLFNSNIASEPVASSPANASTPAPLINSSFNNDDASMVSSTTIAASSASSTH